MCIRLWETYTRPHCFTCVYANGRHALRFNVNVPLGLILHITNHTIVQVYFRRPIVNISNTSSLTTRTNLLIHVIMVYPIIDRSTAGTMLSPLRNGWGPWGTWSVPARCAMWACPTCVDGSYRKPWTSVNTRNTHPLFLFRYVNLYHGYTTIVDQVIYITHCHKPLP